MDDRFPIKPQIITGGEYSQLSAPPSQKSDPVQDVGMLALSEQKNSIENLKTPLKKRRLSQVLPSLSRGKEENQEINQFLKNNLSSAQEVIKGVEHNDFTIYPIIDWVAGGNRLDKGIKAYTESSKAMLNFMEKLSKK